MQATVRDYDATTGTGTVLLDDGRTLTFPATALAGNGLRLLRLGQRVHLEMAGEGVRALRLGGIMEP